MFRLQPPRPTLSNGQPAGSKYPGKQVEQNFGQNHHNFAVGAFMIKIKIHLSATGNKNAQISITSPLGDLFHCFTLWNLFYSLKVPILWQTCFIVSLLSNQASAWLLPWNWMAKSSAKGFCILHITLHYQTSSHFLSTISVDIYPYIYIVIWK